MKKFLSISELSKILNLIDSKTKKPLNHILRYWEKEFRQIKPKKINNRRYYSPKQVETVKLIKFLLKNKGLTISGVKNVLDLNTNKIFKHMVFYNLILTQNLLFFCYPIIGTLIPYLLVMKQTI